MEKILIILSSPLQKKNSVTQNLAQLFAQAYLKIHPQSEINFFDLNDQQKLIDDAILSSHNLKNYHDHLSYELLNKIIESDKLVITSPVINHLPSPLLLKFFNKTLIPNKVFTFKGTKDNKPIHLLKNLSRAVLIITSAGGLPEDNQEFLTTKLIEDYLRTYYGFYNIKKLTFMGTNLALHRHKRASEKALFMIEEIKAIASQF